MWNIFLYGIYYNYVGLITLCGELMSHYNLRGKEQFKLFYIKSWGWDLSYLINYLSSFLNFYLTLLV